MHNTLAIEKALRKRKLLSILNNKINFDLIEMDDIYQASNEDLKYFKTTFENIIFDQNFLKIFNFCHF